MWHYKRTRSDRLKTHNKKWMSRSFLKICRQLFNVRKAFFAINHSNKAIFETATIVVLNASSKIGKLLCISKWVVSDCDYYVLLWLFWLINTDAMVAWKQNWVKVNNITLPSIVNQNTSLKINNTYLEELMKPGKEFKDVSMDGLANRLPSPDGVD